MNVHTLLSIFTVFIGLSQSRILDDVESLIATAGYRFEAHRVETPDGYKLKIHRIFPRRPVWGVKLGPVFIMHGLFGTAADFLMTGKDIALPYLLADHGYDVWMGNSRGNDHSLQHKTMNSKSKDFWNFSWHEIGFYDVPTMIDHMLKITNASRTFYIGHSQGTTSLLVMLSTRPEYNQKIIQAHLMAPAAFMKNLPNPVVKLFINEVEAFINEFGFFDFLAHTKLMKYVQNINSMLCHESSPGFSFCESTMATVCGKNVDEVQLDTQILPDFMKHLAHQISIKQVNHYFQLHSSGKFRQYDYQKNNQKVYNSSSPPDYNLQNVKAPTYIYSGGCDGIVSEIDIENLREILPNVKKYRSIRNFNHCDFNYGKNTRSILFENIVKTMDAERRKRQ